MNLKSPVDLGPVVERLDHVSVGVSTIRGALTLVSLLGGEFRDGGDSESGGFRWVQFDLPGAAKLELITPLATAPANNFLARFLADNGEGIHHLTLKVSDIHAAVARAQSLGHTVVGVDVSNPGWKEAFIHPRSANGVLVQLAEWTDGPVSGRQLTDVIGEGTQ